MVELVAPTYSNTLRRFFVDWNGMGRLGAGVDCIWAGDPVLAPSVGSTVELYGEEGELVVLAIVVGRDNRMGLRCRVERW